MQKEQLRIDKEEKEKIKDQERIEKDRQKELER